MCVCHGGGGADVALIPCPVDELCGSTAIILLPNGSLKLGMELTGMHSPVSFSRHKECAGYLQPQNNLFMKVLARQY